MSNDPIEERRREVIIGEVERQAIVVADYDPAWPGRFRREEAKIRVALGEAALAVEHIGSTSVPGLAAKPIVDVLRVREPDFHEHRMFRTPEKDVHLHVYSTGSPEIERYLLLRDRLRENGEECELYVRTKRELASRDWPSMQHYAEAKTEVIEGIIARAAAARAASEPAVGDQMPG